MKRFTNILVAFDGSPDSVLALEAAETLAKDNTAHLTVAYAHDDSPETVVYSDASNARGIRICIITKRISGLGQHQLHHIRDR